MENKNQTPHINVDFFEDLTGDISTAKSSGVEEIGKRIQILRKEKGLSLEKLSRLTGFDTNLLSDDAHLSHSKFCCQQISSRLS